MDVKPVPDGYHTYTPYFVVHGAADLITFLRRAFGAEETVRMPAPGGRIAHAEVRIGDSTLMLADAHPPDHPAKKLNGLLYVRDVDEAFKRAIVAGGKVVRSPENMFYGDRTCCVADHWENHWMIATHIEDVSPDEMKRRMAAQSHPA
jgi:PhnB protein